jgi:hypothetical protein
MKTHLLRRLKIKITHMPITIEFGLALLFWVMIGIGIFVILLYTGVGILNAMR